MLGAVVLSQDSLEPIIQAIGQKYGVEPALIKAHIKQESNWDVNASRYEAHKGDASWGLMQLLLGTAREILGNPQLTTTQLIQPQVNIEAGTKYIAKQLARYKGDLKSAIAAYNAGTAKLVPGTNNYTNQDYVDKVYRNYLMYRTVGVAMDTDLLPVYLGIGVVGLVVAMAGSKEAA